MERWLRSPPYILGSSDALATTTGMLHQVKAGAWYILLEVDCDKVQFTAWAVNSDVSHTLGACGKAQPSSV